MASGALSCSSLPVHWHLNNNDNLPEREVTSCFHSMRRSCPFSLQWLAISASLYEEHEYKVVDVPLLNIIVGLVRQREALGPRLPHVAFCSCECGAANAVKPPLPLPQMMREHPSKNTHAYRS